MLVILLREMSYALYILLVSIFFAAQGLRCRMEQDSETEEEFENIVRNCLRQENDSQQKGNQYNIKKNDNNNKGYIRNDQQGKINSSGGKRRQEDNYDKDEEEYDYNEYDSDNINNRNKNVQRDQNDQKYRNSYQNQANKQSGTRRNQGSRNHSRNIGSPLESIEPCIIHCIFKQKKMLNQDNYIEKNNAMRVLTQKIHNSELKEFVEDSVNECFDIIDNEKSEGKCEDSKNFALCLEEKGKNNCEDWDTNSNRRGGNNNRYSNNRRGGSQLNKEEKGNNRHSFNNNNERNNGEHYDRNERERSKMKHDNNEERGNNNRRDSNPDNNEQKIKLSDYFQSRG